MPPVVLLELDSRALGMTCRSSAARRPRITAMVNICLLQAGCLVVNAPTANTIAAAEHGIALIAALSRNVAQADASVKAGKWERTKFVGVSIIGKTLAIMGFGKVFLSSGHLCSASAVSLCFTLTCCHLFACRIEMGLNLPFNCLTAEFLATDALLMLECLIRDTQYIERQGRVFPLHSLRYDNDHS